jgi:hypothetical protein
MSLEVCRDVAYQCGEIDDRREGCIADNQDFIKPKR